MRLLFFLTGISLIISTGLHSCSKTTNGQWMIYKETACYPFWVHESSDRKTKNTLETFLKSEGIIPLRIKIKGERILTCETCDCVTGKEYFVQVDESQVGHMAYWGFKIK